MGEGRTLSIWIDCQMPRANTQSAIAHREIDLRPATKQGLRLYATGAVKTLREAADAVGMAPGTLYVAHASATGRREMEKMDVAQTERAVDLSKLIASLGKKAVDKMAHLMDNGGSEAIQLKAAQDLLDRNPETSKTQKLHVETFSVQDEDAKLIAAAMVEAARLRAVHSESSKRDTLAIAEVSSVSTVTEENSNG